MSRIGTYESMLLLDNREVKKGWQALKDDVCGVFKKHGAEVVSARRWDERRLAYPISRQLRGTYLLVYFKSDTQEITGIRRDLEYNEAVMRYLTMAVEEIPEDAFDPEAEFDESEVRVEDVSQLAADAAADDEEEAAEESSEKSDGEKSDGEKSDGEGETAEGGEASAEGDAEGETKAEEGESADKAEEEEK